MKTILYQPLFINPQAYFVFPQLYHIEKGDSYIEPANITGQLIINNLSDGTYSFGTFNDVAEFDKNIVYQTKKSYNGRKSLIHGPVSITDYDELYLGKLRSNENNMFIGCHGDIILFNRSLTEYEISWVKNNIMCSKQQEPDIDL